MWYNGKNKMKIIFIRHGKTKGNLEKRYIGKTDEPLCAQGIEELKNNCAAKKYENVDLVFTSPMNRCIETVKIIYENKNVIEILDFTEMDFGDFEGKNYAELNGNADYQAWIDSNGTLPFPNGENRSDFEKRCMEGLKKMISLAEKNKANTIAAVVHGGTIMAVLSGLGFGSYYDFQIRNGEGYVVDMENKTWNII